MKLRLHHNSLRLRVSQSDLELFKKSGMVEETLDFPSMPLVYILSSSTEIKEIQASFKNGWLSVNVPQAIGAKWSEGDDVGISNTYRGISVLIEKDWACLDGSPAENVDTFPRP